MHGALGRKRQAVYRLPTQMVRLSIPLLGLLPLLYLLGTLLLRGPASSFFLLAERSRRFMHVGLSASRHTCQEGVRA